MDMKRIMTGGLGLAAATITGVLVGMYVRSDWFVGGHDLVGAWVHRSQQYGVTVLTFREDGLMTIENDAGAPAYFPPGSVPYEVREISGSIVVVVGPYRDDADNLEMIPMEVTRVDEDRIVVNGSIEYTRVE